MKYRENFPHIASHLDSKFRKEVEIDKAWEQAGRPSAKTKEIQNNKSWDIWLRNRNRLYRMDIKAQRRKQR